MQQLRPHDLIVQINEARGTTALLVDLPGTVTHDLVDKRPTGRFVGRLGVLELP